MAHVGRAGISQLRSPRRFGHSTTLKTTYFRHVCPSTRKLQGSQNVFIRGQNFSHFLTCHASNLFHQQHDGEAANFTSATRAGRVRVSHSQRASDRVRSLQGSASPMMLSSEEERRLAQKYIHTTRGGRRYHRSVSDR